MAVSAKASQSRVVRARLHNQRGAAVFIVVMVLTLLTAVGIFAVRSASMADVAAGFDREGAQAGLVAEYGVTATAAYLSTGNAIPQIHALAKPPQGFIPPTCESNVLLPGAPTPSPPPQQTAGCLRLDDQAHLAPIFSASSSETLFAPANNAPTAQYPNYPTSTSSLNVNEATDAKLVAEVTEAYPTGLPVPGFQIKDRELYFLAVTAIAQVRPVAACAAGTTTPSAAQTAVRAVIVTPVEVLQ
jgi:hypothetical protein